jgi:hypothetical protein
MTQRVRLTGKFCQYFPLTYEEDHDTWINARALCRLHTCCSTSARASIRILFIVSSYTKDERRIV